MIGTPIVGKPYSATETDIHASVGDHQRSTQDQHYTYRDSSGRVRQEYRTGDGQIGVILISDPVARVGYTIFPSNNQVKATPWTDALTRTPSYLPYLHVERLASRVIDGVSVEGYLGTRVVPAHDMVPERSVLVESWYSPELGIELESRDTSSFAMTVSVLSNVQRGEPDPALFQVPSHHD